jgi:hypothetical protein
MRQSERGEKPQPHVLFMTEAQLKKLDDAVLHRDIGIYNERLKTLKADLIREAHRHEEDFTIIEGDRSPALKFGIFVAFAMIYPRVELFLRIIAEWIALILTGVYTFQLLAYHARKRLGCGLDKHRRGLPVH